jgi:hypothetical protein
VAPQRKTVKSGGLPMELNLTANAGNRERIALFEGARGAQTFYMIC